MRILGLASKRGGLHVSRSAISRLALRGAMGMALLIGGAQHVAFAHDNGPHKTGVQDGYNTEILTDGTAHAVAIGEAAVAKAPQDGVLRAELGHAYLRAGRFESAAAALSDAVALGDTTSRTLLSLALAQIACAQSRAALATLDRGTAISPADLGLALALAGDPGRGIAVLTDAVRDGSASSGLRQNLAYAYALDGRWADASLTAGFDLSPDQVNARLQSWAQSMQSGGERLRVAQLLNVPLVADPGMPAVLALNAVRADAAAAQVATPALVSDVAESPKPPVTTVPAVADPGPPPSAVPAIAALPQVTAVAAPGAFRRPTVRHHGVYLAANHFVQLAAYHSRRSAELGKLLLAKRHPLLRGHGLLVTMARSHGHSYWRVVMASVDRASAADFCSSLKRHGAGCFAYSVRPKTGQALAFFQR